jgi:hypothetical protein
MTGEIRNIEPGQCCRTIVGPAALDYRAMERPDVEVALTARLDMELELDMELAELAGPESTGAVWCLAGSNAWCFSPRPQRPRLPPPPSPSPEPAAVNWSMSPTARPIERLTADLKQQQLPPNLPVLHHPCPPARQPPTSTLGTKTPTNLAPAVDDPSGSSLYRPRIRPPRPLATCSSRLLVLARC